MAQRNTLKLDTSGFETMIKKLESLGGDVQKVVGEALTNAQAKIAKDTEKALSPQYLPAGGIYSKGTTEKSIIKDKPVEWDGYTASIPVGFDYSKPGAGGYLITGTPRMKPDKMLHWIYKQKRYMNGISKDIGDAIADEILLVMNK